MNKAKLALLAVPATFVTSLAQAQAVVPTELQTTADNIEAGFDVVKVVVLAVVVFGIVIGYIKMLKRK